ncbi:MAG: VWA domain-containing protein [Anaerolineae bacterium]
MKSPFRSSLLLLVLLAVVLASCTNNPAAPTSATAGPSADAIQISIIYAPESDLYLKDAIANFNAAYASGKNPLTGNALAAGERPIFVTGKTGSSGTVMQGIVNALIAPNNANVERPTIFAPSVSHWLALANYQSDRQIFDLSNIRPTANAPVVMAIWESRLNAIKKANPGKEIGWEELLDVLKKGWGAYNIAGRQTVYYGHTDPYISSTALSTLMAEFYASARYNAGVSDRNLTAEIVNNPDVRTGVSQIEQLIKHYSERTTEFKEYIAKGPTYLDFVALEENDLIYINQGKTAYKPPERLVALYPKEGTYWHEHPFAIPNTDWVTEDQRNAANIFTDYVVSEPVQRAVLAAGFRPVNSAVPLGYPIVSELGVDPNQPATVLNVPDPDVIAEVQRSWGFVKKKADIWLVIDISGSMRSDGKIDQAKQAALAFLDKVEEQNNVGLIVFNSDVTTVVEIDTVERNKARLQEQIESIVADGGTALFDATSAAIEKFTAAKANLPTATPTPTTAPGATAIPSLLPQERIRAVIVLSDGQDTESKFSNLNDVLALLRNTQEDPNPVIVIPIAYGSDADVATLSAIAKAATTSVQSGDPNNITSVLQVISSYF